MHISLLRRTLEAAAIAVLFAFTAIAHASNLDDAVAAAMRGDYATAYKIILPLAERGEADAQYSLGVMYSNGLSVPQDYKEAVAWYRKAAEQGLAAAQNNLGFMYRNGYGVPENTVLAYMLYNLAAAQGDENAIENRAGVSSAMTKAQIEEAQALSREWSVGKPLPTTTKTFKAAKTAKKAEKPAPAKQQQNSPYPARPAAKPGYTTCNTRCFNGDCYRTYSDGEQVHFQAKRKYNGLSGQWEWDSGGC